MAHAFQSNRVVTPQGIRRAAILLEDGPAGMIRAVCDVADLPADATIIDFGDRAILPGLVDTHVHINEPGRTEWEGFRHSHARGRCRRLHHARRHAAQLPARNHHRRCARTQTRRRGGEVLRRLGRLGRVRRGQSSRTCSRSRAPAFPATNASSSTPAATASP